MTDTLLAAGVAGATSNALLYPLEMIRARLTVSVPGSTFGSVVQTLSREMSGFTPGSLRTLYRGLGASTVAILPEAAITYGLFDLLKRRVQHHTQSTELSVPAAIGIGVVSALVGQTVAYPLELAARRLQVVDQRVDR